MVNRGIVLFAATTLALCIGNVESKEPIVVHDECGENGFCHIKPDNYPQEEIDRLMIKNLPNLHRMKRSAAIPPMALADPSSKYNCKLAKEKEMRPPYTLRSVGKPPAIVIQSAWFQQEVPQVSCRQRNQPCFTGLTTNHIAYCRPKKALIEVFVYNTETQEIQPLKTDIDIDCLCEVEM